MIALLFSAAVGCAEYFDLRSRNNFKPNISCLVFHKTEFHASCASGTTNDRVLVEEASASSIFSRISRLMRAGGAAELKTRVRQVGVFFSSQPSTLDDRLIDAIRGDIEPCGPNSAQSKGKKQFKCRERHGSPCQPFMSKMTLKNKLSLGLIDPIRLCEWGKMRHSLSG